MDALEQQTIDMLRPAVQQEDPRMFILQAKGGHYEIQCVCPDDLWIVDWVEEGCDPDLVYQGNLPDREFFMNVIKYCGGGYLFTGDGLFYKTRIVLDILSEEPIPDHMELKHIVEEYESGMYVADRKVNQTQILSPLEMASELYKFGSEPGFFSIDDYGNPI